MQAAYDIGSTMKAVTIPRIVANYHDDVIEGNQIASATGIRKSYFESRHLMQLPIYSRTQLTSSSRLADRISQISAVGQTFYPLLRFTILREGPERLSEIADVTEGIENLFYRAAANNNTFEGFMNQVKSKRYTWTRIQRMLTHIFTGYTYDIRNAMETPSYLRLLGMTQSGRQYLNENKKRLKLPVSKQSSRLFKSIDQNGYPRFGHVCTWY